MYFPACIGEGEGRSYQKIFFYQYGSPKTTISLLKSAGGINFKKKKKSLLKSEVLWPW